MQKTPAHFKNIEQWKAHRRKFLKAALVAGITTQIPFISGCTNSTEEGNELLTGEQLTILKEVLNILWPSDGNGPGIEELNTLNYFFWVLRDAEKVQSSNNLIVEGIDWANEETKFAYGEGFINVNQMAKETLVATFAQDKYGEKWLDVLLTYTIESLILDPIYGAQPNQVGWKWLNHQQGFPQPTEKNRYEEILKIKQNEI